jgi:hypothetical protein
MKSSMRPQSPRIVVTGLSSKSQANNCSAFFASVTKPESRASAKKPGSWTLASGSTRL